MDFIAPYILFSTALVDMSSISAISLCFLPSILLSKNATLCASVKFAIALCIFSENSLDSKRDERLKVSGDLIGFKFEGTEWGLNDHFYDWLYLNALLQNEVISKKIISYGAFTDIEFNPKRSKNCQAKACALYVSLVKKGILNECLSNKEKFKKIMKSVEGIDSAGVLNTQFSLGL